MVLKIEESFVLGALVPGCLAAELILILMGMVNPLHYATNTL